MQGYTLIEGKYYNTQDGSGPYAIAEDNSVTLMSTSGVSALGELVMLGGWYFDKSNASGPYALDSDGVTHLIVGGSGGGGGGGDVTWSTLQGKPSFIAAGASQEAARNVIQAANLTHTHDQSDVNGLVALITNFNSALSGFGEEFTVVRQEIEESKDYTTLTNKPAFIAEGVSALDVAINKLGLRTGAFSNISAHTVQADVEGNWSVDLSGNDINSIVTVQVTAGVPRGIASVSVASTASITGTLMSGDDATPLSVNTLAPTAGTVYVLVYFN